MKRRKEGGRERGRRKGKSGLVWVQTLRGCWESVIRSR